ncbi:MAG: DUF3794 domain-containing protein [Ruminococcus sp.]|nr:DUF3794 domain-containing protein [Ruminococcus sp.]
MKINKDPIRFSEKICGCSQEQSVELDYVLPDYYPEIFRILKCRAVPEITACAVNGDRITYELTVCLKVIYCAEGSSKPQAVDQKLVYSRTVNMEKRADSPAVYITAQADHINCRAVNRRRIDIRGAVTINIRVMGELETEVVCDAFGGNIQLKKITCPCPSQIIRAQKRVTVSDEFDTGSDLPPIGSILRADAEIVSSDKKIIAGKAAAKGELKISVTYTPSGESDVPVSSVQFSLPFSQLIDLEGLDDTFECRISSSVVSCSASPRSDGDGESRKLECEVLLFIDCAAVKMSMYDIVSDEYSTSFGSSHTCVPVRIEKDPVPVDSVIIVKGVCENKDSPLSVIYDAWCSPAGLHASIVGGNAVISGNVSLTVMGQAENGDFIICETDVPVEEIIDAGSNVFSENADITVSFSVISCGYTISSDHAAELKTEIAARGWISDHNTAEAITDITVDETEPRENNGEYALRLYFAGDGEDVWSIAKRYGASISGVIEENELDGNVVKEKKMLLIPME